MRLKRFLIPAFLVFAILYALSPFDLIADRTPFLGRLDDLLLVVLAVSIWLLNKRVRRRVVDKNLTSPPEEKEP